MSALWYPVPAQYELTIDLDESTGISRDEQPETTLVLRLTTTEDFTLRSLPDREPITDTFLEPTTTATAKTADLFSLPFARRRVAAMLSRYRFPMDGIADDLEIGLAAWVQERVQAAAERRRDTLLLEFSVRVDTHFVCSDEEAFVAQLLRCKGLTTEVYEEEEAGFPAEAEVCAVCLEEFVSGSSTVVRTPCDHVFHVGCASSWVAGQAKSTCPLCRFCFRCSQRNCCCSQLL